MHQRDFTAVGPSTPSIPSGMLFPNLACQRSLTWHTVHIAGNKATPVLLFKNQTSEPRPQYQASQLFGSRPKIAASISRLIPANAQYPS